jgi:hypothetical protein
VKFIPVKSKAGELQAMVDDEDFEQLDKYRWYGNGRAGYAVRNIYILVGGKRVRRSAYLHRDVMNAEPGQIVDHINRNKLDNRKANLRFATRSQNAFNRVLPARGKSGIRGVYWNEHNQKWRTNILVEGKEIHLGFYDDVHEAAEVRQNAERKYYG